MKNEEIEEESELEKAHLAGLDALDSVLKVNGVSKEKTGKIMDVFFHEIVNKKFINPSLISQAEGFRVQIQSVLSDVNKNKLKGFEALMRLDMRLDCPREERTISEDEIRRIRICLEAGFSLSEVSRIFERSKSTVHDIAQNKTHVVEEKQ